MASTAVHSKTVALVVESLFIGAHIVSVFFVTGWSVVCDCGINLPFVVKTLVLPIFEWPF